MQNIPVKIGTVVIAAIVCMMSCSKKQELNPPREKTELRLQLRADELTVEAGSNILFKVTADGQPVTDAELYVDGKKIPSYRHTFSKVGTATVVAKKSGYEESEPLTLTVNEKPHDVDIYVVGEGYHDQLHGIWPMYWKNGEPMPLLLASGHTENPLIYHGIAVSGANVYIAGERVFSGSRAVAIYWANDIYEEMTDPYGFARGLDICVAGGSVYVAGVERTSMLASNAVYWKNGEPVFLTDDESGDTFNAHAAAIAVTGNNVHVAGNIMGAPTYWKNGEAVSLEGQGIVTGIAVSDEGDVYISGYGSNGQRTVAKYWKNGEAFVLGTGERESQANDICVENTNIYAVGWETIVRPSGSGTVRMARYWKNGEAVDLTDGAYRAEGNAISVLGGNVYVAGVEFMNGRERSATYWRNGEAVRLSHEDHSGHAEDIFVVKKTP